MAKETSLELTLKLGGYGRLINPQLMRLTSKKHLHTMPPSSQPASEIRVMSVSVNPQRVVMTSAHFVFHADGDGLPKSLCVSAAPRTQDLGCVSIDQIYIPLDRTAETTITVLTRRKVAEEQYSEVDSALLRNATEERRLILDGMTDDVRESDHRTALATGIFSAIARLPARGETTLLEGIDTQSSYTPMTLNPEGGSACLKRWAKDPQ